MMSKTEAAYRILKEYKRPMSPEEIVEIAIRREMIVTRGKTPQQTMAVDLLHETRRRDARGQEQRFERLAPRLWGLAEWGRNPPKPKSKPRGKSKS